MKVPLNELFDGGLFFIWVVVRNTVGVLHMLNYS